MYKYFPHTSKDLEEMLKVVGCKNIEDLFFDLPSDSLIKDEVVLPSSLSEIELRKLAKTLASKNKVLSCFKGAGAYDVYIPSIIKPLVSRQEFLTSYTPYQPEISQGTLQYIFEYQSLVCELTGMDVANASVYDGATACAEAMFMAINQTRRNRFLVSSTLNPAYLAVIKTYAKYKNIEIVEISDHDYHLNKTELMNLLDENVAGVMVQSPNFYGILEDYETFGEKIHQYKGLFIIVSDIRHYSMIKNPMAWQADIACGDAQTLGLPLSFGGPYLGYMATTNKLLRKLPGRIVGITHDIDGKRGFVLTLQAREQHIRREKAVSNICSNQSLMALWATIYMETLGKKGMMEVENLSYQNAHYLYEKLISSKVATKVTDQPFFNEFIVQLNGDVNKFNIFLKEHGILGGLALTNELMLIAVTETKSQAELDEFVQLGKEFTNGK